MRALALPVLLFGCHAPAVAQSYSVKIVAVQDGDTFTTNQTVFGKAQKIRVAGIDTPESTPAQAKCAAEVALGKAAKDYAIAMVNRSDMRVTLSKVKPDAYNSRYVARAVIRIGGKPIDWAAEMIRAGHAKRYEPIKDKSFKKPDWCGQ